jgi:predicted AAA+ superfamily ATPase
MIDLYSFAHRELLVFHQAFDLFSSVSSSWGNDNTEEQALGEYAEKRGIKGPLRKAAIKLFRDDTNLFTLACERGEMIKECTLYERALKDVIAFEKHLGDGMFKTEWKPVKEKPDDDLERLSALDDPEEFLEALAGMCESNGCGDLAYYPMLEANAFGKAAPIERSDPVRFSDLVGCGRQEELLRQNTEMFLGGMPAHNTLLTGSRGSGKSSCVKALANEYFDQGLRLVDMGKDKIESLPALLETLAARGKKFILFMDDLSYDASESELGRLKSVLEGGARLAPENVLFCATSNRRHLVRETWAEREEVHSSDGASEKLSLSDRFGLNIAFPKPTPEEYIEIAVELAARLGVPLGKDEIRAKALSWELGGIGRSGRSAKQFAERLKAEYAKRENISIRIRS